MAIFLDFKHAIETIDHARLMGKLKHVGMDGNTRPFMYRKLRKDTI